MTWKRIATALVLIPVVVAIVLFGSSTVVAIATAVVTVVALWEYFALGDAIGHRAYRLWTTFCALLMVGAQFFVGRTIAILFNPFGPLRHLEWPSYTRAVLNADSPVMVFFVFLLGLTVLTLWTRRPLVESLPAAGISSSALLLVAFPLSFAVRLHSIPLSGRKLLLFALVITWAADTTAYFVGRAIGKHPLAPHISPKKTWEGSIASMFGSLLIAYPFSVWMRFDLPYLLIMAAIGNVAGQMGDLLESAYKRSAGVKDSGGLLPGHGGILDRIDALILCIPVIWYYICVTSASRLLAAH
jgi:phosphatidate cytidylyltransferase